MGATRLYIKDASELLEWQEAIRAATGRKDVACVLGAWMAGTPSESVATRIADDIRAFAGASPTIYDKALYVIASSLWLPGTALGSAIGNAAFGNKIYTIEDACPGGPSVDDALSILKDADADLWAQVTGLAKKQRAAVAAQANETAKEAIGRTIINAAEYAAEGLSSIGGKVLTVAALGLGAYVVFNLKKLFGGPNG